VFRPDRQQRQASASIIIKDTSIDWKQKDVYIIHINNGEHIQATSAYTMEFLALAAAMKLQTMIPTANTVSVGLASVSRDADSIVSMLRCRRKKLRQASKKHHLLLQCIDNGIHKGCKLPVHVKSHAEKRKAGQENTWTQQEWGKYIADRAAEAEYTTLRNKGLRIHTIEVNAKDFYTDILDYDQWYIGYVDGSPIHPQGILEHVHQVRFSKHIADRDTNRKVRRCDPCWYDHMLRRPFKY